MTQSRIDKGLMAIPMSLAEWFPDYNTTIQVYLDDSSVLHTKNYSSYKALPVKAELEVWQSGLPEIKLRLVMK
jgi:hypothetical protein